MRYRVTHTTAYEYIENVGHSYNEARLSPRNTPHQTLVKSYLDINPLYTDIRFREDFFGNSVAFFSIREPHKKFTVTATSEIDLHSNDRQLDFAMGDSWENVSRILLQRQDTNSIDARQFMLDSPFVSATPSLAAYAKPSFQAGRPLLESVNDLMQRIYHEFTFDPEFTTVATPLADVLEHRRGVCQDFAHLAIGCLRSQGLAARYVSGYIETLPPPGEEKLVGADASHAWFSVYLPETGWMDFDPTNNQLPDDQHITVAWGRDYSDVTPLKGVIFGGQNHELKVSVEVERLPATSGGTTQYLPHG